MKLAWDTVAAVGETVLLLAIMSWGFNFLYWHVWLWFGGFQVVALQCLHDQADCFQAFGAPAQQGPASRQEVPDTADERGGMRDDG